MIKLNKKNLLKTRLTYLQIAILVISIFAFSFIIGLKITSAANENCCLETKEGAICQDFSSSSCQNQCKGNCVPNKCEQISSCKLGCCYDEQEGLCSPNSPKQKCEQEGGEWSEDVNCNIEECRKGCCILGENTGYVTEKRCEVLSRFYGYGFNFQQNKNEVECLSEGKNQKIGACLIGDNACRFGTEANCLRLQGNFHENLLCTNPELNTTCTKTKNTKCREGKDEVYFVDSCGNTANIYDANKINDANYWKNIVNKSDSCSFGNANIKNKNCGNCDYLLGSKCKKAEEKAKYGDYSCGDLNCEDAPWVVENNGNILKTKDREQGEVWCVYDGSVGNGTDIVGSRHWRYYCLDGEVKIEPCSDLRQEICGKIVIENTTEPNNTIEEAESVGCVANRWRECVRVTSEVYFEKTDDLHSQQNVFKEFEKPEKRNEFKKKCLDIGQCNYFELKLSKTPLIPICMPSFPGGLKFYQYENKSEAKQSKEQLTCNVASSIPYIGTCVKVEDSCSGCISGCDCGTDKWLQASNNICRSFGDCGANVNIDSKVTTQGYKSTVGENKAGRSLSKTYLDSLKKLVTSKTEENAIVVYKNVSGVHNISVGAFGRINTGSGGSELPAWTWIMGPFRYFFDLFLPLSVNCEIEKTYYHYTCYPYQAPKGGADCEYCNENPNLKQCSEYRCKSLGAGCEILNADTGKDLCYWQNKNDASAPEIIPWEEILPEGNSYEKETCSSEEGCYKLKGTEVQECIKPYTPYSIGIKSNEPAQCKIERNHTNSFDNMTNWIEDNSYLREHKKNISFISPGHVYESLGRNISNKYNFYIRCSDTNGNANNDELAINLCIDAGPDTSAPIVIGTFPENHDYVAYNISEVAAGFFLNEPSNCKWDKNDTSYEKMKNSMSCETDLFSERGDSTYLCNASIKLTQEKFYVRCKDQPWLVNESKRNINDESYIYELKKSSSQLKITKIEPNKTFVSGNEPASVSLRIETGGGAENGKSVCSFDWLGGWFDFLETSSNIHKQDMSLNRGSYNIPVKCEDVGKNTAEGNIKFKIEVDKTPPKIIRVYNIGALKIITDEDAECVYSNKNCNFAWGNGTEMTGLLREHEASVGIGNTYYIKCKDLWDNKPEGCSIIVKAV